MQHLTGRLGAIALVTATIGLAACGSDDDESTTETAASGTTAAQTTEAPAAADFDAEGLGKAAAEKAGGPVDLPKKKVGFLNIAKAIESAQRAENAFTKAAETLGWEVIACDGQGDPTKIAACGETLLTQGAQAIATNGVEAAQIKTALTRAEQKDVPVAQCTSAVTPSTQFAGSYAPEEAVAGKLAADYLIEQLEQGGRDKTIAVHSFPTGFASLRTGALQEALKDHPDIEIVDEFTTDLADPAGSTQKAVDAQLTQYPKLGAIWVAFDIAIPGAAQAIYGKYPSKSFPDRPLVVGFNANSQSLQWMQRKAIDALSDTAFEDACWVAVDQFAEHFARDTTPAQGPKGAPFAPDYGFEYLQPQLVTKDNIPGKPASDAVDPMPQPTDIPAFFTAKWAAEFGK